MDTPINIKFVNNPTNPSMYIRSQNSKRIKQKLFGIELNLNLLGEVIMEKKEEQEEELMRLQKAYTEAEAELGRFQQEELELVKAGEDPLLTCPHCLVVFSSYTSLTKHKTKCKHYLKEEETPYVFHYRVLEGRDRDQFLISIERLSLHRRINLCVSTRTACKGVFPLIFPVRGDNSGSHMEELGIMGPDAQLALRRALQDGGELYLPERLVLDLPESGRQLYLPPSLLTPTASQRQGDITVESEDNWLRVTLPSSQQEGSEDEDEDENNDGGFTSDSSDDEEDEVWFGQDGGGPAGGGSGQPPPSAAGGGQGGGRGQMRRAAGRQGAGGRSGIPTREDQQVKSSELMTLLTLPCSEDEQAPQPPHRHDVH